MPSGRCTLTRSSPHRDLVTTNGKRTPRSGWNGWVIRVCGASTGPGAFCSFDERLREQPVAPLAAGGAAAALGPDQAAAGAGLQRQVDAGTQLQVVDVAAVAAHVLAVGDALAQAPQRGALVRAQQVDERHQVVLRRKGGMARGGPGEAGRQARGVGGRGVNDGRRGAGCGMAERCLARPPFACPAASALLDCRPLPLSSRVPWLRRADSGRRAGPAAASAWCCWWWRGPAQGGAGRHGHAGGGSGTALNVLAMRASDRRASRPRRKRGVGTGVVQTDGT